MMMAAVGYTVATFIHTVYDPWLMKYLPLVFLMIAMERFLLNQKFKEARFDAREWGMMFAGQWLVILVVLKLIVTFSSGLQVGLEELEYLSGNLLSGFFSNQFLIALVLCFAVWLECGSLADLLDEIGLEADLILHEPAIYEAADKPPARQQLTNHIITLGFLLVMLTGLMRIDLRKALSDTMRFRLVQVNFFEAGGASTLLYFIFGTALFSQIHLIHLITRWRGMKIPISRTIVHNWAYFSLAFLIVLAALVIFLPTDFSLGFLQLLGIILYYFFLVLAIIFQLVWILLIFLFSIPINWLFKNDPISAPRPANPLLRLEEPPPDFANPAMPLAEIIKSIVFWGVFLGVIIFAIVQYARQHEDVAASLKSYGFIRWLIKLWNWLVGIFTGAGQQIVTSVRSGYRRLRSPRKWTRSSRSGRFLGLSRLNPRQRVIFYFLALVRRSGEQGLPRAGSQTPNEYANFMRESLPEVDADLTGMAESFNEARYSQRQIDPDRVGFVKAQWERIRQALRVKEG